MKILIFSFFIAFFIFNESAFALSRLTQSFQRSDPKPDPKKTSQPPATQTGSSTQTTTTPPQTGSSTTTLSNPTATEPAQPFASVVEERDWSTSPTLPPRESQYYYTQRIDTLTPEQRKNLHEQHLNANCVNKTSENVSCGYREKWSHRGDPYFTWDPYMNQIKPETPVDIEVKCNPKTKRFVTNISINQCTQSGDKEVCKKKYFSNPYFNCAKNGPWETCEENFVSSKEVFSDQPQNWLTSPGIYLGHMKTNLPSVISRTEGGNSEVKLVAQEQRIVGSGALYQGARVPNVLWLSNNGNAFHGSQCVDGRPNPRVVCVSVRGMPWPSTGWPVGWDQKISLSSGRDTGPYKIMEDLSVPNLLNGIKKQPCILPNALKMGQINRRPPIWKKKFTDWLSWRAEPG